MWKQIISAAILLGCAVITAMVLWSLPDPETEISTTASDIRSNDVHHLTTAPTTTPAPMCAPQRKKRDVSTEKTFFCSNLDKYRERMIFCYTNVYFNALFIIPLNQLRNYQGQIATHWPGYEWYLRVAGDDLKGVPGWGGAFATTSQWDPDSYGWDAKPWKDITSNLTVTPSHVSFRINASTLPLPARLQVRGVHLHCSGIKICAWFAGEDPCWFMQFCKDTLLISETPWTN